MDGVLVGWMVEWFDGVIDRWRMDGWKYRQTDRYKEEWIEGRRDGCTKQ